MKRLQWSAAALAELQNAVRYVAQDSPKAAIDQLDRIDGAARSLAETPIGRPGRVAGTYEKRVVQTPYIIVYAFDASTLTILRVIHGRRDWPEGDFPPVT
ncbi:MAG: type II toxin-antitoxin system RelE/ParE family toxin [Oceanicaulis sp.]